MAQRVTLIDDLDGTPLDEDGSTIAFRIDGADYEIDLARGNRERFTNALAPFVEAARKPKSQGTRRGVTTPAKGANDRDRLAAIRAWAKENGYDVSNRGRVARPVVEAYEAAH